MVLTLGAGAHGFTLNYEIGAFTLTHRGTMIPPATREFAVNASNRRFWQEPVRSYVGRCLEGATGLHGIDFNMRWIASIVAEVHRVPVRGGLFMCPRDIKDPAKPGPAGCACCMRPTRWPCSSSTPPPPPSASAS